MAAKKSQSVIIAIKDEFMNRFEETVKRLKKIGVSDMISMHNIGIVKGQVNAAELEKIKEMPGVLEVRVEQKINLS